MSPCPAVGNYVADDPIMLVGQTDDAMLGSVTSTALTQETGLFALRAVAGHLPESSIVVFLPRRTYDLKSHLFLQCWRIHFRRECWKDSLVLQGQRDVLLRWLSV